MAKLKYNYTQDKLQEIQAAGDSNVGLKFNPISMGSGGPGHFVRLSVFDSSDNFVRSFLTNVSNEGVPVIYGSNASTPTIYQSPLSPDGKPILAGVVSAGGVTVDPVGTLSAINFCNGEQADVVDSQLIASNAQILGGVNQISYWDDGWVVEQRGVMIPSAVWSNITCMSVGTTDYEVIGSPQLNIYRTINDDNVNFYFKPTEALSSIILPTGDYSLQFEFLRSTIDVLASSIVNPRYIIREISPSRKEIRIGPGSDGPIPFVLNNSTQEGQLGFQQTFKNLLESSSDPTGVYKFDYVVGLPKGRSLPVVNYEFDNRSSTSPTLIIKLGEELPADIVVLNQISIDQQIFTTQTEQIFYESDLHREQQTGAGLDAQQFGGFSQVEVSEQINSVAEDPFQSVADLTGSLVDTSILSWVNSGSGFGVDINLNINYNDFTNHTFFGSAASKLDNFKNKLTNIENQLSRISQSLSSSFVSMDGDSTSLVKSRKTSFEEIQRIKDTFTPYERFLYYDYQSNSSASAPGIGANLAHSKPVTGSYTQLTSYGGFPLVYKHSAPGADDGTSDSQHNGLDLFRGKYKAEDKPFFNYSGSLFLSFLLKGDHDIGDFTLENINTRYDEFEKGKLPNTALGSGSILSETVTGSEYRRYIFEASQSFWRPYRQQRLNMYNWNDNAWSDNVDFYQIVSSSEAQSSASNSPSASNPDSYAIQAAGQFYKSIGTTFLTGSTALFSGSFMPSGELFRVSASLRTRGGAVAPSGIAANVTSSFITDVRLTTKNPIDVYPFHSIYKVSSTEFSSWFDGLRASASAYDDNNIHALVNNIPTAIKEDSQSTELLSFIKLMGEQYDLLRNYIENFEKLSSRSYNSQDGVPPNLLPILGKNLGWDFTSPFTGSLSEYFGSSQENIRVGGRSVEEITTNTWRKILNNLVRVYKTKGSAASISALLNTYGYPADILTVAETGGSLEEHNPSIISNDVSTLLSGLSGQADNVSFIQTTEEFFSFIINNDPNRTLSLDWYTNDADNIESLEFIINPNPSSNNQVIFENSGSGGETLWDIRLKAGSSTETQGQIEFRINNSPNGSGSIEDNAVSMSVPTSGYKSGNDYWNVMLSRVSSSVSGSGVQGYKLFTGLQSEDKIVEFNSVSMSISGTAVINEVNYNINSNWFSTGSRAKTDNGNLLVGRTYTGSIAEIRTWQTQLSASKFKQHVLNKKSTVGNNVTASFSELAYRFALQENFTTGSAMKIEDANPNKIKDYSFTLLAGSNSGSVFYDSDLITLNKFSIRTGGTDQQDGNKVLINPKETVVGNLDINQTSVRTIYDKTHENKRSRSNKLNLVKSPSKVLNDFIINSLADYDVSGKFADPENVYKDSYEELNKFREELFNQNNISIDINKWVDAQSKTFNPGLISSIKSNLPGRSTVENVGVMFEPTILERNKFKQPIATSDFTSSHYEMNADVSTFYSIQDTKIDELITDTISVDKDINKEGSLQTLINTETQVTNDILQTATKQISLDSDVDINSVVIETANNETSIESIQDINKLVVKDVTVEPLPSSNYTGISSGSTKSYVDLHGSWGMTVGDTQFIHFGAPGKNGLFNTFDIEKRVTFEIIGDVEIIASHTKKFITDDKILINDFRSLGTTSTNIEFTNIENFHNREIRDVDTNYVYKSYVNTVDNEEGKQSGRPVGKTSYFNTGSDGKLTYPSNHWSNFSDDAFHSNLTKGHQNIGGSFLNLENKNDLSTASFYSVNVSGENQLTVRRGK